MRQLRSDVEDLQVKLKLARYDTMDLTQEVRAMQKAQAASATKEAGEACLCGGK